MGIVCAFHVNGACRMGITRSAKPPCRQIADEGMNEFVGRNHLMCDEWRNGRLAQIPQAEKTGQKARQKQPDHLGWAEHISGHGRGGRGGHGAEFRLARGGVDKFFWGGRVARPSRNWLSRVS